MKKLVYKGFTFPYNPTETSWSCEKSVIKHKYPQVNSVELEELGNNARVISCSGTFFGKDAYKLWRSLLKWYNNHGAGKVYHPIYTDVNWGVMINLKSNVGPSKNTITYSFDIVAGTKNLSGITVVSKIKTEKVNNTVKTNTKKKTTNPSNNNNGSNNSGGSSGGGSSNSGLTNGKYTTTTTTVTTVMVSDDSQLQVGDMVLVNGYLYTMPKKTLLVPSPPKQYISNKRMIVTRLLDDDAGNAYPVHLGTGLYCWAALSSVRKNFKTTKTITKDAKVYIVKQGDTIQKICARFGVSWKDVAKYNKIKDATSIKVGQKLIISVSS